jgi:hypothetical protein
MFFTLLSQHVDQQPRQLGAYIFIALPMVAIVTSWTSLLVDYYARYKPESWLARGNSPKFLQLYPLISLFVSMIVLCAGIFFLLPATTAGH